MVGSEGNRKYIPGECTWTVAENATGLDKIKQALGDDYASHKKKLKEFLCNYFSTVPGCNERQGRSIVCVGATPGGGKILKVRWAMSGQGKSGGLRMIFGAHCEELRITIAAAWFRRDYPHNNVVEEVISGMP